MMAERAVVVSHTTIMRWVIRYAPEFEKRVGEGTVKLTNVHSHIPHFDAG